MVQLANTRALQAWESGFKSQFPHQKNLVTISLTNKSGNIAWL